jgi:putative endonuclease
MFERLSIIPKGTDPAHSDSGKLGKLGEDIATRFLEPRGFRIIMRNFTVFLGRNSKGVRVKGEIDIVALDGESLCLIEVKTRRLEEFNVPQLTVSPRKRRQIKRVGTRFTRIFGLVEMSTRLDVVSVTIPKNRSRPTISLERDLSF